MNTQKEKTFRDLPHRGCSGEPFMNNITLERLINFFNLSVRLSFLTGKLSKSSPLSTISLTMSRPPVKKSAFLSNQLVERKQRKTNPKALQKHIVEGKLANSRILSILRNTQNKSRGKRIPFSDYLLCLTSSSCKISK